jgi:hypothetical protein
MANRVCLKSEEVHRIARAALDRGYSSGDKDIVRKIRELQAIVLPEDRQRRINGRSEITGKPERPNILDTMDVLAANGYKPRPPVIPAEEIQMCLHDPDVHPPLPEPINGHDVEIAADAEAESSLGATVDLFMKSCAKQLVEQFMSHLRTELAAAVQNEFIPSLMPSLKAAKLARQKILVIGLKPQQAAMINNEFGSDYDLRFVDSSSNPGAVNGKLNVDRIIGMVSFMSHSIEDHVKHRPGYKRVSGGMDSLRDELRSIQ